MRLALALRFGLVVALGCAAACSSEANEPEAPVRITPHVFVGHIAGSQALVAIVESDETVVAYTCGVGDKLATHTGWYFGIKRNDVGQNIELVNGPSGLRMRGELTPLGGSGTLTLADASEVAFTVEPARGEAGLYDYEDSANLVGFIRDNDGQTAGNSVLRTPTIGVATTTTAPTSSPVTTAPAGTTPPATTTTTTTPFVPVLIDNATRLVITTPVTRAETRVVQRSGPVVVFMMHGMADNLGMAPATAQDNFAECAGTKDTPFYGRCEWGQDFLPGLFGASNVGAQLTALDGSDATGDNFIRAMQNVRDFPDENLGHRMSGDCVADPQATEVVDGRFAKHFIAPGPQRTSAQILALQRFGIPPAPPPIAAFVTWRDPTRGLVFSGRRVTRQVYAALRWYESTYKITPGVILLAQSFGGLASRFMLSKPDPQQLNADTNRENVPLCTEDLAKMDYVRDRTLYLLTLATPHEGSYLAEWGPPVKAALRALLTELRQGLASSELARVLRGMATISTLVHANLPILEVNASIISSIEGFLPQLDNAAALLDMRLASMAKQNLGPISPERARRTAASPIVGGARTLIPVYATLSRSPGSDAFDGPDIVKGFEKLKPKRAKARGWIMQTMLVSDVMTRQFVPKGFGDATVEPYAAHRNVLDRRERLFDSSPTTQQLETRFARDIRALITTASPWLIGRFGNTADGMISALQGEVSVALPHVIAPIHTAQKWRLGFNGTTAEVPIPVFQCGGREIPIELDALARKLVQSYGRTPQVLAAINGKNLTTLLEALAVVIAESDTFAQSVADWFVGEVKAQLALGPLPVACDVRPNNPFDIFSIGELANWKVAAGKGQVPVPVFIGTGQPTSDGEMDTDGAVHSASALGFTLARVPFYFEHNRSDDAGKLASWYRLYDNPVTERRNHGQQYENDVGLWIRSAFLAAQVGPVPARDTFSVWPE